MSKLQILMYFIISASLSYSQDTLNLRFVHAENVYNNHVGNEWRFGTFIGDVQLNLGDGINIVYNSLEENFALKAVLQEGREQYNDSNEKSINLSLLDLKNNHNEGFYVEIELMERNGRFAGNKALWKFYYELNFSKSKSE